MIGRLIKVRAKQMVNATTLTGECFRGILYDHDRQGVILRDASALVSSDKSVIPVDGELYLRWTQIAYLQFT